MKRAAISLLVLAAGLLCTLILHQFNGLQGIDCSPHCINQKTIDNEAKAIIIIGIPASVGLGIWYFIDHKPK